MPVAEDAQFQEYAAARLVPLRRLAFLMCGDWHLADDAVSAVMVKLYVAWPRLRRVDDIDAYVRKMVIRAIVDERRRPWRRERPAQYPISEEQPDVEDNADDRLVLREALSRMPPKRRAILVLRFFEELNVEETAAAMGCSTGTVKSQTARGLVALRRLLPADYEMMFGGKP